MDNVGRLKECIEIFERHLKYEETEGTHTYTMCKCGRKGSRRYKCVLCLREEIIKLKDELEEVLISGGQSNE